jgi:hypothetical protein
LLKDIFTNICVHGIYINFFWHWKSYNVICCLTQHKSEQVAQSYLITHTVTVLCSVQAAHRNSDSILIWFSGVFENLVRRRWPGGTQRNLQMRAVLLCDITLQVVVISYRRFGTIHRSIFRGEEPNPFGILDSWRWKR